MAQIDNVFTAFWMNTATAPGTPLTGLSATITIIDDTGVVVINSQAMTNLGAGWYKYIFTTMDVNKNYLYTCNPGVTAYIDSGVTDKRMNNIDSAISEIRGGGGGSVNLSGVTGSIRNISKKLEETKEEIIAKIESSKEEIENKIVSEKLDISPIIDKIDSIEIPEPKEVNLTAINTSLGTIKTQNTKLNTKLTEYIQEEDKKDKEILDTIESEADLIEEKLDEMYNNEADQHDMEQFQKEADEIETNQSNNGNN